jgi:hypothetical protein
MVGRALSFLSGFFHGRAAGNREKSWIADSRLEIPDFTIAGFRKNFYAKFVSQTFLARAVH